jgi:hypothetical protein
MWPKPFKRVSVKMGEPLRWHPGSANGAGPSSGDQRLFTQQIMGAIGELSGQQQVDHYAKRDTGRMSAPGSEAEPVAAAS